MPQPLTVCPVCSGTLFIRELECLNCHTRVIGEFDPVDKSMDIEPELLDFIKVFIFAEGSIKQSEKLLNCSYPKIKNLLKKAKAALGMDESNDINPEVIIDQLDRGNITVDEALKKLQKS